MDIYIYIFIEYDNSDNHNEKNRNKIIVVIIMIIICTYIYVYLFMFAGNSELDAQKFKTYFLLGVQYIVCSVNNISQKKIGRKKNLLQPCRPSL